MIEKKEANGKWQNTENAKLKDCMFFNTKLDNTKPKVLLHSCCGPCSSSVIERLVADYQVTVYFYNPNITDEKEYYLRRDTQVEFIDKFNLATKSDIKYIEGPFDPENFYSCANGFEDEAEGGLRCTKCFELRLRKTAEESLKGGYDYFATTLTVSPYKNYKIISAIGNNLSDEIGIKYLDMDFKKKNGFQRSIELSKEYGLYRQHYCGCMFSER